MKQKHIDANREARLWIKDIIAPGLLFGAAVLQIPEVKAAVNDKIAELKAKRRNK